MARTNGKTEIEEQGLDAEQELPAADDTEDRQAERLESPATPRVSEAEKFRAERDTLLDRLARMEAEFDNARKRAAKEQQDFRDYALADSIKALIPVLDSFDRALQTSPEKSEFHMGIELIHKQLQDALAKIGVRLVPAKGERFDPRIHEAIEMVDTEEVEDHQVIGEPHRGDTPKGRLLRSASESGSRYYRQEVGES